MRVFVTGSSGTFGSAYVRHALKNGAQRVVGLARGEHRQAALLRDIDDPRLECWIGDVRDSDRLRWAFRWAPDVVVHCAALKRVETCERDPEEAHATNAVGTLNVVKAAMWAKVPKVLVISSDKSVMSETTYGTTKAMAEALALGQNTRRGDLPTRISVARYGNVVGSQGSVLDAIATARETGRFAITDPEATRFWWSVDEAVRFVDSVLARMCGGEIWVPKLHAARVVDLVRAIAPDVTFDVTGMRGREKRHESMIAPSETAWEFEDCYVVSDTQPYVMERELETRDSYRPKRVDGVAMPAGFTYTSADHPEPVSFRADPPVEVPDAYPV